MRDVLVEAIHSYATARATNDAGLVRLAGIQLNALLDQVFFVEPDVGPQPPEEDELEEEFEEELEEEALSD